LPAIHTSKITRDPTKAGKKIVVVTGNISGPARDFARSGRQRRGNFPCLPRVRWIKIAQKIHARCTGNIPNAFSAVQKNAHCQRLLGSHGIAECRAQPCRAGPAGPRPLRPYGYKRNSTKVRKCGWSRKKDPLDSRLATAKRHG